MRLSNEEISDIARRELRQVNAMERIADALEIQNELKAIEVMNGSIPNNGFERKQRQALVRDIFEERKSKGL